MDKIAEIKEALEKATPGPWCMVDDTMINLTDKITIGEVYDEENQDLIANAPEWLSSLLSELERAQTENNSLKWQMDELANMPWVELEKENRKLREERDSWERVARRVEEEKQSAQQEIERLKKQDADVIINYALERQKLIEGLRVMTDSDDEWYVGRIPMQEFARKLYREIGVTVE